MDPGLGEDDDVEGGVELAVAESRETMAMAAPRGDLDRRAAGVAGEGGVRAEAPGVGLDQDAGGDEVADARDREEGRGEWPDHPPDLGPQLSHAAGDLADPGQELAADPDEDALAPWRPRLRGASCRDAHEGALGPELFEELARR